MLTHSPSRSRSVTSSHTRSGGTAISIDVRTLAMSGLLVVGVVMHTAPSATRTGLSMREILASDVRTVAETPWRHDRARRKSAPHPTPHPRRRGAPEPTKVLRTGTLGTKCPRRSYLAAVDGR